MTATETRGPTREDLSGAQPHAGGHPTPRQYVNIALILGVLTAAEVAASFIELPGPLFLGGLISLAVAKFFLVVGYYMHIKFDSVMFRRLFAFGVILAVSVFLLVLGLFALSGPTGAV